MDNIKYEPEETFCEALFLLFLHKVYMASVVILHFLRLVGNESLSNVEARQKEVKLAGIAIKEAKKVLLNIFHPSCTLTLTSTLNTIKKFRDYKSFTRK